MFFEHDSIGRNHIHGIFYARKNIRYSLVKQDGVHFHIGLLESLEDIATWLLYCKKEIWDIENQKMIEEEYSKHYGFIDNK